MSNGNGEGSRLTRFRARVKQEEKALADFNKRMKESTRVKLVGMSSKDKIRKENLTSSLRGAKEALKLALKEKK